MSSIGPTRERLRLDPVAYEGLRQQVLRRDGWRCQLCASMSSLEVHHQEFRSHRGHDIKENLITLCSSCHAVFHRCSNGEPKNLHHRHNLHKLFGFWRLQFMTVSAFWRSRQHIILETQLVDEKLGRLIEYEPATFHVTVRVESQLP